VEEASASHQRGQAIVLIAIMLAVIVGMAALGLPRIRLSRALSVG